MPFLSSILVLFHCHSYVIQPLWGLAIALIYPVPTPRLTLLVAYPKSILLHPHVFLSYCKDLGLLASGKGPFVVRVC